VSETIAKLVLGLPAGRAPRDVGGRNRHILLTLAVNADDTGVTRVSIATLCRQTERAPNVVRDGISNGIERGLLTITPGTGPTTYQFDLDALRSKQQEAVNRANNSIYVLLEFGATERALKALDRTGCATLDQLDHAISEYQNLPEAFQTGFHRYLDARNFGAQSAKQVLDGYAEYRRIKALRQHYDHNDTSAEMENGTWINPQEKP
jgi:hypothetical protein